MIFFLQNLGISRRKEPLFEAVEIPENEATYYPYDSNTPLFELSTQPIKQHKINFPNFFPFSKINVPNPLRSLSQSKSISFIFFPKIKLNSKLQLNYHPNLKSLVKYVLEDLGILKFNRGVVLYIIIRARDYLWIACLLNSNFRIAQIRICSREMRGQTTLKKIFLSTGQR